MNKIIFDQPAPEYHLTKGLNKSSIDKLLRCPLEYKLDRDEGQRREPTPSMKFGTMLHTLVLQPELFGQEFHVMKNPGNTKDGKTEKREAEAANLICVSQSDYEKASTMCRRLYEDETCGRLLKMDGWPEVSVYWDLLRFNGGESSVRQCKGRIDRISRDSDGFWLLDVKTTSDSPLLTDISKHVADYGYHRQAAWYLDAMEVLKDETEKLGLGRCKGFVFLFTSTAQPHLCTASQLSDKSLDLGIRECFMAEERLTQCEKTGVWPTYYPHIVSADLPNWYYRDSKLMQKDAEADEQPAEEQDSAEEEAGSSPAL